jgi:ABC-type antimicrobial peptide transport system permease subunit
VDALKQQLTKAFKGKVIPGQPTNKAGKPYKNLYYNQAYVRVDDMQYVSKVQEEIRSMGFQASSNVEWMSQVQEQSRSIQAALGGIGAVSLFVAAIGIANTMMMSIYERTKEIGIIKVLGCDMSAIRNMFLAEAGFIGLIGGAVGLILSYIISVLINFVAKESYYAGISYIPFYLAVMALVFAVVIGMLAGLFPALRAMKLSPLAAIRNE